MRTAPKLLAAAGLALTLGACNGAMFASPQALAFAKEKSSEIGAKGVIVFEMQRGAANRLIDACLAKPDPIGQAIECVKSALKLID